MQILTIFEIYAKSQTIVGNNINYYITILHLDRNFKVIQIYDACIFLFSLNTTKLSQEMPIIFKFVLFIKVFYVIETDGKFTLLHR